MDAIELLGKLRIRRWRNLQMPDIRTKRFSASEIWKRWNLLSHASLRQEHTQTHTETHTHTEKVHKHTENIQTQNRSKQMNRQAHAHAHTRTFTHILHVVLTFVQSVDFRDLVPIKDERVRLFLFVGRRQADFFQAGVGEVSNRPFLLHLRLGCLAAEASQFLRSPGRVTRKKVGILEVFVSLEHSGKNINATARI